MDLTVNQYIKYVEVIVIMRAPSVRFRRIVSLSAAPVAVLLAGAMVWQGSNAAFSSHTRNSGNNWETGSVSLTNDGGSAMFNVRNATPGNTETKCIVVSSTSDVPAKVMTHIEDLGANGLEPYIKLKMERGTGGSFGSCAGFNSLAVVDFQPLSTLSTTYFDFATGTLPWSTLGVTAGEPAETMSYRFTWVFDTGSLDQAAVNALQGEAVTATLAWELQNT
jgi:hypothetical protein